MNSEDFWASVSKIVKEGFTPEGLKQLDHYAELFINGRLVYQRFSPFEQHGCAAGGATHVVASLLAGAETAPDRDAAPDGDDFKRELQRGAQQADRIERWARAVGCWTERIDDSLPKMHVYAWFQATKYHRSGEGKITVRPGQASNSIYLGAFSK